MVTDSRDPIVPSGITSALVGASGSTEATKAAGQQDGCANAYHYLFENNPLPMWVFARDSLRFLAVNDAALSTYGYSREEWLSLGLLDIRPPEEAMAVVEAARKTSGVRPLICVWTHIRKDGGRMRVEVHARDVEFEGQSARLVLAINVTEREQAHAAQATLAAIVESTDDAILSQSMDGIIRSWNPSAETLYGYTTDEAVGQHILMLYPPDRRQEEATSISRIRDGERVVRLESKRKRKDGSEFDVSIAMSPILTDQGEIVGASKIVHDITGRKQAQLQLLEAKQTLEQTVIERTAQLQAALVQAESADRHKSAFLATMSHELRTPLNSIIGFTGILLQSLAGPLNPEQRKQLGMVHGSAWHLLALINDVLDISKIEARQLQVHPEPFDLAPLVERAVASVGPQATAKGLTLEAELPAGPIKIVSDRRRVEQVLINLLGNAIKFTEHGGVTLSVQSTAEAWPSADAGTSKVIRIQVTDTGIGIRPADLVKVFRPFHQVDAGLARTHEGTGLGLAICSRLVELMGGTITLESELGLGSTFTVTLPESGVPSQ